MNDINLELRDVNGSVGGINYWTQVQVSHPNGKYILEGRPGSGEMLLLLVFWCLS